MRNPRIWVGFAVSALFLALLLRQVDRGELVTALAGVHGEWLLLAVAVEFAALWVRGLRWRVVLATTVRVPTAEAWSVLLIGYAANNVLPMRAGEFVRAQLLHDQRGDSRHGLVSASAGVD